MVVVLLYRCRAQMLCAPAWSLVLNGFMIIGLPSRPDSAVRRQMNGPDLFKKENIAQAERTLAVPA